MTHKEPFVSHYDPSVFRTSCLYPSANVPKQPPVRGLVKDPVRLTITVKDIDLEGLDSSTPDKAYNIRQRKLQRRRAQSARSQQENSVSQQLAVKPPPKTIKPPPISPHIRKLFGQSARFIPIYEGTFYKDRIQNPSEPKPIGLLATAQKGQRPQTVIPKANPRNHRMNSLESSSGSPAFKEEE